MSEVLLDVLSTLYHNPDQNAKTQASHWLEEWRLKTEAWKAADGILHSDMRSVEVLFFCSQTLVFKVQQDFEELPESEWPRLRDSLMTLLLKFGREEGMVIVKKQLALAIAAFCAHVSASFWPSSNGIQWIAERCGQMQDVASVSSLMELLIVFPEEAQSHRIGLHPQRRVEHLRELEESLPTVLHILEQCRSVASVSELLSALSNWITLCQESSLHGSLAALGPFVQLAMEALDDPSSFSAAVDFVSELLYVTENTSDLPEINKVTEFVASSVVQYQSQFRQDCFDNDKMAGLARLFCDLGIHHEHLVLEENETCTAMIEAVLTVTSHPDEDVHQHAFDFWDRVTHRVACLVNRGEVSSQRAAYYVSVFERLMTALLDLAKLPEDYMEMSVEERRDISRRRISMAIADAAEVIGEQRSLKSLTEALSHANQSGTQNWRQIESLLFAIDSLSSNCKKCKTDMVGPLFQALGAVPDVTAVQAEMCECLVSYAHWLPTLAEQTGTDPLALLLPVLFKNMALPEWAPHAVDAFSAVCKSCRSYLAAHATELLELHHRVVAAADAFHERTTSAASFVMKEHEAMEVVGALCHGISRTGNDDVAVHFLFTIADGVLEDIATVAGDAKLTSPRKEAKLAILVARLKMGFRNCGIRSVANQLLRRVCSDLLQMASNASSSESLIEEICTCMRYALKSAGDSSGESAHTLSTSLPMLFSTNRHCGYLYVASEIAKIFGKTPSQSPMVHRLVADMLMVVCGSLKSESSFQESPDLVDDAFLMAGRVLNYCPDALLTHTTLLPEILDTAGNGILVQHEDACRSVLRFLIDLTETNKHKDRVRSVLFPRGPHLTQMLLAGVVGMLPLRVLDDVAHTLRAFVRHSDGHGVSWISHVFTLLPDQVLSADEKTNFTEALRSPDVHESERAFLRSIDDLADICRRSRIVRNAAQTALLPKSHV